MDSRRSSNDNVKLEAKTSFGGRTLEFDFPSVRIGVAEYDEGPTGCTVFQFPTGSNAAVDVRGGAHATTYTEALHGGYGFLNALCFAGGSLYGLEAAAGVAAELFASADYSTKWDEIALVSGGIIFDFGARETSIYPDKELGRAALRAAQPGRFPQGARGAGRSATAGKLLPPPYAREHGGQGGAFAQRGDLRLAVFTVVNAVGAIVDRDGHVVCGHRDSRTGERVHAAQALAELTAAPQTPQEAATGNTTLTLVATNRRLHPFSLVQLARQVHASMARAIQPFHTSSDGDVLWAVTTNELPAAPDDERMLSVQASELAWDAVLNCIPDDASR